MSEFEFALKWLLGRLWTRESEIY